VGAEEVRGVGASEEEAEPVVEQTLDPVDIPDDPSPVVEAVGRPLERADLVAQIRRWRYSPEKTSWPVSFVPRPRSVQAPKMSRSPELP
jgi:hypothetical protein